MVNITRRSLFEEFSRTRFGYRGRPRGRPNDMVHLYDAFKSIVYLVYKYDLDPQLLLDAIVEAWKNDIAFYEDLRIHCRTVNSSSAMFLLTLQEKVVSQFPVTLKLLNNPDSLRKYLDDFPFTRFRKHNVTREKTKIKDLRFKMRGVNLTASVIEVPPQVRVNTRVGTQAYVSNVQIADDTGSIRLGLWNEQIDQVQVGDKIEIHDGYVTQYMGVPQLSLGRNGTLSIKLTQVDDGRDKS